MRLNRGITLMATEQRMAEELAAPYPSDSLFERYSWFYALCREHLFSDHSDEIARLFWEHAVPAEGTHLVELGCGPGFYSCAFAERFPQMRTTGVDLSHNLLSRARTRAAQRRLKNCNFYHADVHSLPASVQPVDNIVVSRLFLIVPNREDVMAEVFRALRPGGRCFIAEPVSALRTQLPLSAMWLLAKLTSFSRKPYIEPHRVKTMGPAEFETLLHTQPWSSVRVIRTGRYQYAVCEKPLESAEEQAVA